MGEQKNLVLRFRVKLNGTKIYDFLYPVILGPGWTACLPAVSVDGKILGIEISETDQNSIDCPSCGKPEPVKL